MQQWRGGAQRRQGGGVLLLALEVVSPDRPAIDREGINLNGFKDVWLKDGSKARIKR